MSSFTRDKHRRGGNPGLLLALVPAVLLALLMASLYIVPLPWRLTWPWVPSLGVELALYVDGLSAQFLLLITGIGTMVFVYGAGYLAENPRRNRVFVLLLLFMMAMIGAVMSDNLLLLFVFWELTTVLSFLLIGVDHDQQASRKSAQQALLVTGSGGLFLLAGIILLGQIGGSYSLQTLFTQAPLLQEDARLKAALTLIFIGAFCKSAQFPFHFWLPNAMSAPTPVSAYLHSATMVKLGIYLLARLDAAFSDLLFWQYALISTGTFTAVIAAIQTIRERDLKRILAWSTVATLGTLTMLVGLPGNSAALAVAALFFAHALYKAPLFFVAGNLDHGAGTRAIDKLTGMRRYMPWTAIVALLAALSMAGLPLTFGFIAKGAIVHAKEQVDALQLVSYAAMFVNGVSVAVAAIAAVHIFWGRERSPRQVQPHEVPVTMLLPPLILVALGLLFGLVPTMVDPALGAAVHAMSPGFDVTTVSESYEFLAVMKTMLGAILLGCAILLSWNRLDLLLRRADRLHKIGPEAWYWRSLELLPLLAARQTRLLQHGRLPHYLLTMIGAATLFILALLFAARPDWNWPDLQTLSAPVFGASLLIAAGALVAMFVRDHLVLLLVSGLVGYGCAVLFLFTGAPDVAFTQFAVETIFVVVVAAVLLRLRRTHLDMRAVSTEARLRPLALAVAIVFGASLTGLVLLMSGLPFDSVLADFYGEQSLPAANGRNVVNLILVDFRALDTLGEITVLVFALLAALPLLKRLGRRQP